MGFWVSLIRVRFTLLHLFLDQALHLHKTGMLHWANQTKYFKH